MPEFGYRQVDVTGNVAEGAFLCVLTGFGAVGLPDPRKWHRNGLKAGFRAALGEGDRGSCRVQACRDPVAKILCG
jgi:hypothetical protein